MAVYTKLVVMLSIWYLLPLGKNSNEFYPQRCFSTNWLKQEKKDFSDKKLLLPLLDNYDIFAHGTVIFYATEFRVYLRTACIAHVVAQLGVWPCNTVFVRFFFQPICFRLKRTFWPRMVFDFQFIVQLTLWQTRHVFNPATI